MLKKIRQILYSFYSFIYFPSFRYSIYFSFFQNFLNYSPREKIIKTTMEFISHSNIKGDYLEFGVYKGNTFIAAYNFAQKMALRLMRFYAFDSFQGLPELGGVDNNKFCEFNKGQYFCNLSEFKKNISRRGVKLDKIEIIPGWYNEVLNKETKNKIGIKKAAVIWIDCDLYESTVPVLNFITDYVQDGTVLIFDDWFCFKGNPNYGEQKAFKEWLKKNSKIIITEFHKFAWHGNSFIIHLN